MPALYQSCPQGCASEDWSQLTSAKVRKRACTRTGPSNCGYEDVATIRGAPHWRIGGTSEDRCPGMGGAGEREQGVQQLSRSYSSTWLPWCRSGWGLVMAGRGTHLSSALLLRPMTCDVSLS